MILTLDECKMILGITVNTYDEKIRQLIPYVQDDIIYYCDNPFDDPTIFVQCSIGLDFYRGNTASATTSPDYIHDNIDRFSTVGLTDGMDIVIVGGANEGVHTIASVSTDTLKVTSTGVFVGQKQTAYYRSPGTIRVARVRWPKAVQLIAAKMVWHLIDTPTVRSADVKSEKIDDYSVTYADQTAIGAHMYPIALVNSLRPYRRAVMV